MHHVTRVPEGIALFLRVTPSAAFFPLRLRRGLLIPPISGPLFSFFLFFFLSFVFVRAPLSRNSASIAHCHLRFLAPGDRGETDRKGRRPRCRNSQQFCNDAMHASWETDNDIWRRNDGRDERNGRTTWTCRSSESKISLVLSFSELEVDKTRILSVLVKRIFISFRRNIDDIRKWRYKNILSIFLFFSYSSESVETRGSEKSCANLKNPFYFYSKVKQANIDYSFWTRKIKFVNCQISYLNDRNSNYEY